MFYKPDALDFLTLSHCLVLKVWLILASVIKYKEKIDYSSIAISAKLTSNFTINPKGIEYFSGLGFDEFFNIRQTKASSLEYSGPIVSHMQDFLKTPLDKQGFFRLLYQVVNALLKLQDANVLWNRVVRDIEHVYVFEATRKIKLIYLPINEGLPNNSALDLIRTIACETNLEPGIDFSFVSNFIVFLNGLEFFDPESISIYIKNEIPNVDIDDVFSAVGVSTGLGSQAFSMNSTAVNDEEEETGLLSDESAGSFSGGIELDDDEETSLLVEDVVIYPLLYRIKTSEMIDVDKPVFTIGKNRQVVDYAVTDNKTVSRTHANIITRDGRYYVLDLGSKNKTYVNDVPVEPGVEHEIQIGDCIKLSNEKFIVRDRESL